ncbi:TIR-like protein FxsC [Phytohabitans sp. ZYX-F-186]|uniref:TIR-like protein FxsC n=1 Tax=Phytohabitans maris TaxID=3071409 RepID=A0ABU0Z868_9ACTN|nr:TIR-like protein FxsC [Phytohabitans sp. ZYX-F-186]MDQ7903252.1 TIR-like protein FxsC [Phytohabitans sp. ZYX-F-186]
MSPTKGTYFFLSYARAAPPTDNARTDTDTWVREFFRDLSQEVRQRARQQPGVEIGFLDLEVPPGSDSRAALAAALGAAQVFVPLYSPGYFGNSWSMREQESFRTRTAAAGSPSDRVIPVLWVPFPSWETKVEVERARELGTGIPEYAENGMRALRMLSYYDGPYQVVLERLAGRIVDLAERHPLAPSLAPDPHDDRLPVEREVAFEVTVLAPTKADLPPDRTGDSYGETSAQWRPFSTRQALPIAEDAASTAERLGLPTRIVSFTEAGGPVAGRPAVLLIDPWVIAGSGGAQALRTVAQDLPDWVVPLIVVNEDDAQHTARGEGLADEAAAILFAADARRPERVGQVSEFVRIMPSLVAKARRQYLKNAPVFPSDGKPTERARLTDPTP